MPTEMTLDELEAAEPCDLGASDWQSVDQHQVDLFAAATGDDSWLHVDPARAATGPFGRTVAHGYLEVALLPRLLAQVITIIDMRGRINYGIDRLRFVAPLPVGANVRVRAQLRSSERRRDGVLYKLGVELEIMDEPKPAMVGEILFLAF